MVRQESDRDLFSVGWSDRDLFLSVGKTVIFFCRLVRQESDRDLFLSVGQTGIFFCRLVRQESDRDPQVCLSVGQTDLFFLLVGQTGIFFCRMVRLIFSVCRMVRLIFFCRLVRQESDRDLFLSAAQTGISSLPVGWSHRQTKTVRAQGSVAVTLLATLVQ